MVGLRLNAFTRLIPFAGFFVVRLGKVRLGLG
jgi:hypothetical protein